jgi:hypothetical protein
MIDIINELKTLGYKIIPPNDYCTNYTIKEDDAVYILSEIDNNYSNDYLINEMLKDLILQTPNITKYKAIIQKIKDFNNNPIFNNFMLITSTEEVIKFMNLTNEEHEMCYTTFDEFK